MHAPTGSVDAGAGLRRPAIDFRDASVRFGDFTAMGPVNLTVERGEFLVIVGPSGCGKSTLLNLVAGTLQPFTGETIFNGAPVEGLNPAVGYITQKNYCLPWLTVEGNVRLPLEFRRFPKAQVASLAASALERVGLRGFEKAYPRQLSGGMLQRVMIARTLVYEPDIYLMDEPFGSLDALLRTKMHDEILHLWKDTDATFVFVTHDLAEAVTLADRVVVMSGRPGQVKLTLDIDLPRPRDVVDIQSNPRFGGYIKTLWEALDLN
ncbi:ABC transporter ATP-binding protein [Agaricicola taiwanensis]|uniref:ABC transporter ATP-binding protein n=1 Tax=Agaricicola taiwanensis TaxID=591372 RepID=A0A8J2VM42_9RHOB|nr:ABC transporter ATP-binding protein [Agaricicola taiwanensis]GGE31688.1 ABC transporter ATP-binding protein [Agaricicola taiwanensis]